MNHTFVSIRRPTWLAKLRSHRIQALAVAVALLATVAVVAKIWYDSAQEANTPEVAAPAAEKIEGLVKLSGEKLASARLHIAPCQMRDLAEFRTVPGRISYSGNNRLELKAPAAGLVTQVFVAPEQHVKKGDRLAVLTSREIGLARDEVARCQADLTIVQKKADWASHIAANVADLLAALKSRPNPADVRQKFEGRVLGEYRDAILAAYSKLVLATAVAAQTAPLEQQRSISGRIAEERRSNEETAAAAFNAACEQSQFDSTQARDKSVADVQQAERLLAIARERLQSLGVTSTEPVAESGGALSELVIHAPFDGIVDERNVVDAAQVAAGQTLFVVANPDTLWVSADIHEEDWNSLKTAAAHELLVQAPAGKTPEAVAHVKFTEGVVSTETRAVTLVGELDNRERLYRPGMFVWVSVAVTLPRRVLAAPASAVMRHELGAFVFVAEDADTFRRANVTLGLETPEYVEITSGLQEGQSVVDQGAFYLKSELLLEHEAE
jgi:cobalt-zinc-cadmium efflux system membrane fusion protein